MPITKGTHGTSCGTKPSVSSGTNYCIDFFSLFLLAVQVPITKGTHGTSCGTKPSVSSGTNYCIVLFNLLIFFSFSLSLIFFL